MFDPQFDPHKRRLHIRYTRLWTVDQAKQFVKDFREILRKTAVGGEFTLLDDLSDWPTQTKEVAEICNELPDVVLEMPVTRNAMVIPQALLRIQVKRTLVNLPQCRVFDSYAQADVWLSEVEVR